MAEPVTVDVDYSYDGEQKFYAVSLSTDTWFATLHIPPEHVALLPQVTSRAWDDGSLRIGDSAGVSAFWSVNSKEDNDTVWILIGHDDETWDIALAVPAATVDEILAQIAALDAP